MNSENENNKEMQERGPVVHRREFVAGAAAMGAATGGLPLLATTSVEAAEPETGGHFRFGLGHGSTSDSIDPATYENDFTIFSCYCYRGHLTEVAPDGQLVGDIAESWEPSADAKSWTFKIRQGVEFHNGKTVDAYDVVASYNHHRGAESKSAAKPIVQPIVDIVADGKDTIVFELEAGNADFPFIVSDYHMAIMPAKSDGSADWESATGTGPFKMSSSEPGVRATFVRNPNFHKTHGPYFDSVELITIADVSARTIALRTGEIDMMDRVDLKTGRLLAEDPDIRLEEYSGTAHYTIPMDTRRAPFNDVNVRRALKYAVDREELVRTILHGHGTVGNDHPISRANRYYASDLEQTAYDPDKARFYLKQAGLDSLSVDLSAADAAFAGAVDAGVLYKEHAADAGITVNVVREPNDGYWANVWMKKGWCFSYWAGRPTEDWMFSMAYAEGAPWNETYWANDRFNTLLALGRSELDAEIRREIYAEMQAICRDEGGSVIPMFNNYVNAVRTNVSRPELVAVNYNNDGHKAAERWWFSK